MPLDGTEFEAFGNGPLAKLGAVESLLIDEKQWCKGKLRDKDGRYCLAGAVQAVEARQLLNPIILRAAREVSGKRYWRIESFNDHPGTTPADILRVLRRARENIIAGMSEGNPRPWHKRWVQSWRCWCGSVPAPYRGGGFQRADGTALIDEGRPVGSTSPAPAGAYGNGTRPVSAPDQPAHRGLVRATSKPFAGVK